MLKRGQGDGFFAEFVGEGSGLGDSFFAESFNFVCVCVWVCACLCHGKDARSHSMIICLSM